MIRLLIIVLITISGCGKKGKLSLDESESIINQERNYKF